MYQKQKNDNDCSGFMNSVFTLFTWCVKQLNSARADRKSYDTHSCLLVMAALSVASYFQRLTEILKPEYHKGILRDFFFLYFLISVFYYTLLQFLLHFASMCEVFWHMP